MTNLSNVLSAVMITVFVFGSAATSFAGEPGETTEGTYWDATIKAAQATAQAWRDSYALAWRPYRQNEGSTS